jgi:hypothetical protein
MLLQPCLNPGPDHPCSLQPCLSPALTHAFCNPVTPLPSPMAPANPCHHLWNTPDTPLPSPTLLQPCTCTPLPSPMPFTSLCILALPATHLPPLAATLALIHKDGSDTILPLPMPSATLSHPCPSPATLALIHEDGSDTTLPLPMPSATLYSPARLLHPLHSSKKTVLTQLCPFPCSAMQPWTPLLLKMPPG